MKIVYVLTRADAVGGASVHVRDLAREMEASGHDVAVLLGGEGLVAEHLRSAGIRVRTLQHLRREINPLKDSRAGRELVMELREIRPDLVSTHTAKAGWIGRAACAWVGIPAVYTPHGWAVTDRLSPRQGRVYRVAERLAARWADAIVCVSESERRIAIEAGIGPSTRLHVIHNGIRDIEPELRANPSISPPRLISVARFEAPKDHELLLTALGDLRKLDWELDLVGDGPLEGDMRALAARLGIADRTRFRGYLPEPATALASAQIFVLSSRSEGFPRSVLEAMRAGLPVVASDVGGLREAVHQGESGFLFPHGSREALKDSLRTLIKETPERKRMGFAGRLLYEFQFRFERMFQETNALYASVLGKRRH